MEIGDRIKKLRGKDTRKTLANKLNTHTNTLYNYEKGLRSPDSEILEKLLDIYPETSAKWLISGHGPQFEVDVNLDKERINAYGRRVRIVLEKYFEFIQKHEPSRIPYHIERLFIKTIEASEENNVLQWDLKHEIKLLNKV